MSANFSVDPPLVDCFEDVITVALSVYFVAYILLLPLFILVLYMGVQQWRKRRSVAVAAATSHSDVITFHMVSLELLGVFCSFFYCFGAFTDRQMLIEVGKKISYSVSVGQCLFHTLTCVDRYLAVVHPITYLGLRQAAGVRIRHVSVGCVWAISLMMIPLLHLDQFTVVSGALGLILSFAIVSFCSLSVFCILIRPGPGGGGGNTKRVGQSKKRALHTMMAIMAALLLKFQSALLCTVIFAAVSACPNFFGLLIIWFSLPSSLVLPLLFLHRAGKLPGCKHNDEPQ